MQPMLSQDALIRALATWVSAHPNPHERVFQLFGTGRSYSPSEILEELQTETEVGKLLMRVLRNSARRSSPEEVVARFTAKAARVQGSQTTAAV